MPERFAAFAATVTIPGFIFVTTSLCVLEEGSPLLVNI